ncbi:hypothetical protein LNO81_08235 [Klebsiella variicola subsp. variicola]|nr:hypothetical protein [Klebsiella variicola subsp. variicola]
MGETERRREKQQRYNEEHGIVPQGLNKKVVDILQLGQGLAKTKAKGRGKAKTVEPAGLKRRGDDAKKRCSRRSTSWKGR